MTFSGMHQRVHPEKLPEGLCVSEQNAAHGTRELWVPRQGLARAAGLARLTARIDSVGWGECGLKTALIRADSDGNIHGDSIAAADVSAEWDPPPRRDFAYTPPTLVNADGGILTSGGYLTWTAPDPYVWGYNIYRDGNLIDTVQDLSYDDTGESGTPDYQVEPVYPDGSTGPSLAQLLTAALSYTITPAAGAADEYDSGAGAVVARLAGGVDFAEAATEYVQAGGFSVSARVQAEYTPLVDEYVVAGLRVDFEDGTWVSGIILTKSNLSGFFVRTHLGQSNGIFFATGQDKPDGTLYIWRSAIDENVRIRYAGNGVDHTGYFNIHNSASSVRKFSWGEADSPVSYDDRPSFWDPSW